MSYTTYHTINLTVSVASHAPEALARRIMDGIVDRHPHNVDSVSVDRVTVDLIKTGTRNR